MKDIRTNMSGLHTDMSTSPQISSENLIEMTVSCCECQVVYAYSLDVNHYDDKGVFKVCKQFFSH